MIIDVHAHALSPQLAREYARDPHSVIEEPEPGVFAIRGYGPIDPPAYDLETRLASLRDRKVDLQLISAPMFPGVGMAEDVAGARRINHSTARLASESEGALIGLAVSPLAEPAQAAHELRRAVETYGFHAAHLSTTAAGRPLDGPEYEEFWTVMEELQLFAVMHPMTGATRESLNPYSLVALIDWPQETAIAVSRMIFSGLLERHPDLRICLCHGGGTLPYLSGRMDRGYDAPQYEANPDCRAHISAPPSTYLRRFYFDSLVGADTPLRFLIDLVGADRVMFGTDYPFEIGDAEGTHALPTINALPAGDRDRILGGNAAAALKRAGLELRESPGAVRAQAHRNSAGSER